MLNNKKPALRKFTLGIGFLLIVAGAAFSVRAQTEGRINSQSTSPSSEVLSSSAQRVLFDSSAFWGPGVPSPYSDRGYLISYKIESLSAGTENVMLYGKNGQKVREAAIWFPESTRVAITSAAVTPDGRIVASGEADKADGTRAPFIALVDPSGKVMSAIQTEGFYPTNVCVAPDNTVWSFGSTLWDKVNHRPLPGDLLRHFAFGTGQLAGYIPSSAFPAPSSHDSHTLMRCSSTAVAVLSGPENAYILMPYDGKVPQIYDSTLPTGLWLIGFGILASGKSYAVLINRERAEDPTQGLYSMQLDVAARAVRWSPVEGTVGTRSDPATVIRLWGADGEYLVLGRGQDPAGIAAVHWATPTRK